MEDCSIDSSSEEHCEQDRGKLLTLPSELLVYIISFLTISRDKVKLRCVSNEVSKRLRSLCNTPSLWRKFIWPHFDIHREEYCVKSVLKSYGQFVKRFSFPHHVIPSKLTFLQYCSNVTELSLPIVKLSPDKLEMII